MTTTPTQHDPICHMDIDVRDAAGRSEHEGATYYFCSPGCKTEFDADPAAALQAEAAYDHSQPMQHDMSMMGHDAAPAKKPWWRFWS